MVTDRTEREALMTVVEQNLDALDIEFEPGMEPFIVRFAERLLAAGFHRTPTPHSESDGPENGHTFEVSVRSRGASTVIGSGIYSDANWWGDPFVTRVRAWNQQDALMAASQVPLNEWDQPSETPTPHVVTTVEELNAALVQDCAIRDAGGDLLDYDFVTDQFLDRDGGVVEYVRFPATVLAPAPAPIDRESIEFDGTNLDEVAEFLDRHDMPYWRDGDFIGTDSSFHGQGEDALKPGDWLEAHPPVGVYRKPVDREALKSDVSLAIENAYYGDPGTGSQWDLMADAAIAAIEGVSRG